MGKNEKRIALLVNAIRLSELEDNEVFFVDKAIYQNRRRTLVGEIRRIASELNMGYADMKKVVTVTIPQEVIDSRRSSGKIFITEDELLNRNIGEITGLGIRAGYKADHQSEDGFGNISSALASFLGQRNFVREIPELKQYLVRDVPGFLVQE
jgi:DNA-directed RNA polymerase beta subunit